MELSDFKVGQTVVVETGPKNSYESTVVKVGRKYITISGPWYPRFHIVSANSKYCVETDGGLNRKLFPSRKAYDDYCEWDSLLCWFQQFCHGQGLRHSSLEQLRDAKQILIGNNKEE